MKKYIVAAVCVCLMCVSSVSAQNQAQPFVAPQTGVGVPQTTVAPVYPGPVYPAPAPGFQTPIMQPPAGQGWYPNAPVYPTYPQYNPPVVQTPNVVTGVQFDAWGRPIVNSQSTTVLNSATQPGRDQYVAGSLRQVNRYEMDQFGRRVHVTGWEWIGAFDGQPHGNLNRQVVTTGPGGTNVQNDVIMFSTDGAQPNTPPQPAGNGSGNGG
ncbi:MAG: hypothetical protein AAF456_25725 [Planctomycetota bacterium]